MSPLTWIAVALVGGSGAVARFVLDGYVSGRAGGGLPVGTFAINITGAFVLGLLDAALSNSTALLIAGTATIGSYTTFSTWMLETHRLREEAELLPAFGNVALSLFVGLGAVALGHLVGTHA